MKIKHWQEFTALIALCGATLLTGCATAEESTNQSLSQEEFRRVYPRQYLNSLDPSERRAAEESFIRDDDLAKKR